MRIGIDCRRISHPEAGVVSGIGQYIHHLVAALIEEAPLDELVLFFDDHGAAQAKHELTHGRTNVQVRVIPFKRLGRLPLLRSHALVSTLFTRERLDVLHGPANIIPLMYEGASVVTIHDLAVYDHPEWFPSTFPGADSFSQRVIVPRSVSAARRVIAVSEATRCDIERLFDADSTKLHVVHEAAAIADMSPVSTAQVLAKYGIKDGKFVLTLATIEPRKNISSLVWAFTSAAKDGRIPAEVPLIIAGPAGWKSEETFEAIDAASVTLGAHRIKWIGIVTEAEKTVLLASALVFVFPSFYEGFGLPPLEAMALGTPVIASNTGSLPEVCGDAGILVDPADTDGLATALAEIFADPVATAALAEKGRVQAAKFSWQRAARETLEVYRKALEE